MVLQRRFNVVVASILVGVWSLFAPLAAAQNDPASNPASGLRVSPTRAELTVAPGASDVAKFTVTNVTGGNIVVKSEVSDFEANIDGSIKLVDNDQPSANSIQSFVKPVADTQLAAGESFDAEIPVNVASGTAPGAYYGAMLFQAVPIKEGGQDQGQVALSGSIGVVMLIQVPGAVTEKMQLVSMKAAKEVKQGDGTVVKASNLFSKPPTKIQVTVKNVGNSFLKPFGKVTVQDWSGKEVYSYEINNTDPRGNVLPNTSRTFTDDLKNIGSLGRYKIISGVTYGDGGDILTQESTFWVIPVWAVIVALVLVVLIVAGIFYLVRRFKNRR